MTKLAGPTISLEDRLPEMTELHALAGKLGAQARTRCEAEVKVRGHVLPIYSFVLGAEDPTRPTLLIVGGVHGLERIGTLIAISYLNTILNLLKWDRAFQDLLKQVRIVIMPLINPGGMLANTRSNPQGIDLMRNAPIDAEFAPNVKLVGGHRLSPLLPWYRGVAGLDMEPEAQALCEVVRREVFPASCSIAIDLHSGFGLLDRLWFPYARSRRPFANLTEIMSLKERLDTALPHHVYRMEPQSHQYVTHGDLWDFLYEEHRQNSVERLFLPMCLEMGSWLWIKKNPRQLLTAAGLFNPILPHRLQRTIRRHVALLEFLLRATYSFRNWAQLEGAARERMRSSAMAHWYRTGPMKGAKSEGAFTDVNLEGSAW